VIRFVRWFFGELPSWDRDPDSSEIVFWVGLVGCIAFYLGDQVPVRGHPLLNGAWRGVVHGALPLAAVVALEGGLRLRKGQWLRGDRGTQLLWMVGLAGVSTPVILRLWLWGARDFLSQPGWLWVPALVGVLCLLMAAHRDGADLSSWGLGLGDHRWWLPRVGITLGVLVPALVAVVALDPGLADFYPTWQESRTSWAFFALQHLGVGLDFLGWEMLFRGFLLFGIARRGDAVVAIWLQAIPFFLLHHDKPTVELLTSLPGGLAAGWFCLRSGSYLPLFAIHWVQITVVGVAAVCLGS